MMVIPLYAMEEYASAYTEGTADLGQRGPVTTTPLHANVRYRTSVTGSKKEAYPCSLLYQDSWDQKYGNCTSEIP